MKTAVIGGTFDPVHLGHLHLLHSLIEFTDYQRVLIVPVANPPHKEREAAVSAQDRVSMLNLALDDYHQIYTDDREVQILIDQLEIERGGTSYMFDTVQEIYKRYEITGQLGMVIGDDLLPGLRRWYRFDELRHSVEFIICRRAAVRPQQILPPGVVGTFLENPILEDSSTHIRELLSKKQNFDYELTSLLPKSVVQFIEEHGLYRD
jgi:nicotinate-nucleotide adenylyltransferase